MQYYTMKNNTKTNQRFIYFLQELNKFYYVLFDLAIQSIILSTGLLTQQPGHN